MNFLLLLVIHFVFEKPVPWWLWLLVGAFNWLTITVEEAKLKKMQNEVRKVRIVQ